MVLDVAGVVNATCVHIRWLDALCLILVLFGAYSLSFSKSVYDQVIILMCLVCFLAKQHTTLQSKDVILMFLFYKVVQKQQSGRWGIILSKNCLIC